MTTTIKRSLIASFLNTTPSTTATWSIIGPGVTTGKITYNPKTLQETYINEDSGRTLVESYLPNMPVEATVISGDPVFNFVDALRQARAVLAASETQVINVWKYLTGPAYVAEKQTVAIQIDDFGGPGGEVAKIKFTLNYQGAPTLGTFNPSTLTWADA
jgi:hypothetical protein